MWRETKTGEWYWPLHAFRQEDHLRVWRLDAGKKVGWHGAIVIDGEYSHHLDPPKPTVEEAREEIYRVTFRWFQHLDANPEARAAFLLEANRPRDEGYFRALLAGFLA